MAICLCYTDSSRFGILKRKEAKAIQGRGLELAGPGFGKRPNGQISGLAARISQILHSPFFSSWKGAERSQIGRSLHFKQGWLFIHCAIRTVYQRLAKRKKERSRPIFSIFLPRGWPSPERSQMTRSLHFNPGWPFLHCAV